MNVNHRGYLIGEKFCKCCKVIKPEKDFQSNISNVDGLSSKCRPCQAKYFHTIFYPNNREKLINRQKERYNKAKKQVLTHYGGEHPSCTCCGEDVYELLTIDHINNDGKQHRISMKKMGEDTAIVFWLIHHSFPEGFEVTCYNCNIGRSHTENKICPHKRGN